MSVETEEATKLRFAIVDLREWLNGDGLDPPSAYAVETVLLAARSYYETLLQDQEGR
jgi:hypothetical protein